MQYLLNSHSKRPNGFGSLLGGKVVHLVFLAGAMAALRHARMPCIYHID